MSDTRWLAYMLATTFHETAYQMWPIEEYGKGSGRYYGTPDPETGETDYGRGFVQRDGTIRSATARLNLSCRALTTSVTQRLAKRTATPPGRTTTVRRHRSTTACS